MTPVFQTKHRENGERGNCLAASLASIFDLDLDEVPPFEDLPPGTWRQAMQDWVGELGYTFAQEGPEFVPGDDYYIMVGQTQTGSRHASVYAGGKLAHDPKEGGAPLVATEYVIYFSDM